MNKRDIKTVDITSHAVEGPDLQGRGKRERQRNNGVLRKSNRITMCRLRHEATTTIIALVGFIHVLMLQTYFYINLCIS
jgi:hypothetical protein